MDMRWRIELLGGLRAEGAGQVLTRFRTQKTGLLLAYLALYRRRNHSREALIELFWPESEPDAGRNSLSQALSWLRRRLEPSGVPRGVVLVADRASVRLSPDVVTTDAVAFEAALRAAAQAGSDAERAERLVQAVALYRGPLLAGYHEPWLLAERERLAQLYIRALRQLIKGMERAGDVNGALSYARRGVRADPLSEPAQRDLIRLLATSGQPEAALRQYRELERLLKQELGSAPAAATRALAQEIERLRLLHQPSSAASPPGPPRAGVTSGGILLTDAPGENRLVTVLCAGLCHSTAMSIDPDPEAIAAQFERFLQAMGEILDTYQGRLDRVLEEGVLALFGVPYLHEEDPERAIRAALAIREAAHALGLEVTAGINTGEVYVGAASAEAPGEEGRSRVRRSSAGIVGPVVSLAARLQEQAQAGQIIVSETAYRRTRRAFAFSPLSLEIPGSTGRVNGYSVASVLPRPEKPYGIEGLQADLIGREKELAALREALEDLLQGRGRMVSLVGDAGVGKSRLVAELKLALGSRLSALGESRAFPRPSFAGCPEPRAESRELPLWLEGRCFELGMTASYSLFVDLFRGYFAWRPEGSDAERGERLIAFLRALVEQGGLTAERADEMGPLLGNLLSIRFGSDWDDRLKNAAADQIRHQTFMAIRDFLSALAERQPLVLVLEDLHWADSLSLDVISLLMETLSRAPLFLLCVYRPEREHRCRRLGALAAQRCPERYRELHLTELTPEQSSRLVDALLGREGIPPTVKGAILAKARGNPFFVEEVVRALVDTGILYRDGEVWRAREEAPALPLPESIQSITGSRVDRLAPDSKRVLETAAVIGRLFRRRWLEDAMPEAIAVERAVEDLEDRGFIDEGAVVPEEEYSFKHVLTQEAIYRRLLRRSRAAIHQRVAEVIEHLYPEGLEAYYEQLAYHYERSDAYEKAIDYLLKAGEKARRAYLNDEALGYFQRALERLDGQTPGVLGEERRLAALKGLGQTYHGMGRIAEAEQCFRQAIDVGQKMGLATRELVQLYYWLAYMLYWLSRYDEEVRIAEEGLALLGDDVESLEAALMNAIVALGFLHKGDLDKYREFNLRNSSFLLGLPYTEELRWVYANIAEVYDGDKDVQKPMKWLRALERMAQQHHDARALGEVHYRIGSNILEARGDLRAALSRYQQGLDVFTEIGDDKLGNTCLLCLSTAFIALGDLQQGAECARKALAFSQGIGTTRDIARAYLRMGIISLCRGRGDEATDALRKTVELYREIGHGAQAEAALRLGHACLAQGERREASRQFQEVIRLAGSEVDWIAAALSGLEEAYEDPELFRAFCHGLREERADLGTASFVQWFLEPVQPSPSSHTLNHDPFAASLSPLWVWQDPLGDCSFSIQDGLVIRAANGRNLWGANQSAPRLLQPASGEFAVETVCLPAWRDQPALGGLLIWQDAENFLRLDRGAGGKYEISFRGCLRGEHQILGRGRLPCDRVFLRLERQMSHVHALCSADGQDWFTVGYVELSRDDLVEVGIYAIGLDALARTLYPGAYTNGTAIRFASFRLFV